MEGGASSTKPAIAGGSYLWLHGTSGGGSVVGAAAECVCMCVCMYVCMCVCVCARARTLNVRV